MAIITETDHMLAKKRLVKGSERCGARGRAMLMYLSGYCDLWTLFWHLRGINVNFKICLYVKRGQGEFSWGCPR